MKTLLLTGFEPFSVHATNPTMELVNCFNNEVINNFKIISRVLPVEYDESIKQIETMIDQYNPDIVLSLGLAADRTEITPELVAINYQHSHTPDNSGVIRLFSQINTKGKESFYSNLPIQKIIETLNNISIPAKLSSTAGTYVCNSVMYASLRKIHQDKRNCLCGFIHIPLQLNFKMLHNAVTACINSF